MLANTKQFSSCIRRPLVQSRHVYKLPATNLSTLAKTPKKLVSEYNPVFEDVHVTLKDAFGLTFAGHREPGYAVKILDIREGSEAHRTGKYMLETLFQMIKQGGEYKHVVINCLLSDLVMECINSHYHKGRDYLIHMWLFQDEIWE